MRSLWKDILTAFLIGMVLPGLMLNFGVMLMRNFTPVSEIQITIPEETEDKTISLPILLRQPGQLPEQQDMDAYLTCVLLAEMPAAFEEEALKAQSVAARTYARKAWVTGGKHGDGSVCTQPGCCQAYMEPEDYLKKGGTEAGLEKIRRAVYATSGQCLEYEGELIEATYFSCSGGRTEDAAAVWGTEYPYLQAMDSPGEEQAAWFTDSVSFTPEQFQICLGTELTGTPETWFGPVTYTDGGGVESIVIGEESYEGTAMRSMLGLRSTAFEIDAGKEVITITTRGYGHRVGMSQYGAEAMAVAGSTYEQILAYYYPGAKLVTIRP